MKTLVALGAVAGGGYLLLKYLQDNYVGTEGVIVGTGGEEEDIVVQAGNGPEVVETMPKEWPTPDPGSFEEGKVIQAALSPVFALDPVIASWQMNSDQWNWYRMKGGGDAPAVDLFPPGDRGYGMTAREYHEARQAKGLSGLGQARLPGLANQWEVSQKKWRTM